ncbi:IS21 family transposase [Streptomyces sp. SDT5-1]|uniref:IS21 family transposase n=1 Tax=Streptomyces sp. SDT5-1 TaxID=3406418 RepID=UPI003FD42D85
MPPSTKVALYAAIRRDATSAWPEPRKKLPPLPTRLDPYKELIDAMLRDDLRAPPKQRHTAKRDRLVDEHAAERISYGMVRDYVRLRREEIRIAAGYGTEKAFVPQSHRPGVEAEVDFGDVSVRLAGETVKCVLFSFRMSYSGKAVHRVFATGGQEAFFEGHVHAFSVLGGIPTGKVRYDNLNSAVAQVLGFNRARVETERWTAFRSHYGLEAFYCRPGIEGAHEKGGVEGQIGYFRRNHFVPVPEVDSLAELNELVDRWDQEDDGRRIRSRLRTIGESFTIEAPLLKPLPLEDFETGRLFSLRVNRYAQIGVRANHYSVPARLIGRQVRVVLHASELVVYDHGVEVARHERLMGKAQDRFVLDHYLELLIRKPGAFPGSTALEQAKAAGKFTPVHEAWWAEACKLHGDRDGTRALIQVLLLSRHIGHEHLVAGLASALRAGAMTSDAVALEARKAAETDDRGAVSSPLKPSGPRPARVPKVTSLTERRLAKLPPDTRPMPSVTIYDQLLRRSRSHGRGHFEGEMP